MIGSVTDGQVNVGKAEKKQAHALWEQVIAAKGGREKLYQVKALAITDKMFGYPQVDLFVFPDKNFSWSDTRPTVFSSHASVINFEKNVRIFVPGKDPKDVRQVSPDPQLRSVFRRVQMDYLLETPWLKPEPVVAGEEKLGSQMRDVVTVKHEQWLEKFYLDKKSRLPVRISTYPVGEPNFEVQRMDFSDYREFDGLMLPQVKSVNGQKPIRQSFEINPAYDPAVFERVPDMSAGADQWRKRVPTEPK